MSPIDTTIIAIYLLITIIVGIVTGKDVKSVSDFAVGKKDFLTVTLVMTIFATYVDGEMIFSEIAQIYQYGISYTILMTLATTSSLLMYGFIAKRMDKYRKFISVGDIMGHLYGKKAQIMTGISGFLISASFVAAQFKALSFVFNYFYETNSITGVLLSAVIITLYSGFGGVRAVTWTDVVQFFILICAVPMVTSVALNKVGGIYQLFAQLPAEKLYLIPEDPKIAVKYFAIFIAVAIPLCSPPMVQRMLMTRDSKQSTKAYFISALVCASLMCVDSLAALSASIINKSVDPNNAFIFLVDTAMPSGLKGFAAAGIIAIIMSTADSFMNTAAVSFSHDFYKTLRGKSINDEDELKVTKSITLAIGLIGIVIALRFDSLIDMMLYSYLLWGPIVTVPLLAGIFDIKASKESFYLSSGGGIITAILWDLTNLDEITYLDELIPSILVSAIMFFASIPFYKKRNKII